MTLLPFLWSSYARIDIFQHTRTKLMQPPRLILPGSKFGSEEKESPIDIGTYEISALIPDYLHCVL